MDLKGHLSTHATRHNTEGILERFCRTACLEGVLCVRFTGSQEQQNAINCLSGTQPRRSWRLCWVSFEITFAKAEVLASWLGRKKPSPGVTVLGVSASVQGPKLAGASQSCPSQAPPGNTNSRGLNTNRRGIKLYWVLETLSKDFSYKQWWKTHLPPILSKSNIRSGEDYVELIWTCSVAKCLFVTPWTVTHQALLSVGFPRQEYWSGLPFPTPRDLPNAGIIALAGEFFTTELPGKPLLTPV